VADPLVTWSVIKAIARGIRRWRTRRAMRAWREEHGGPPDEILEDFNSQPDEDFMSEAQLSFVRGLLKLAAGALAAKGFIDAGDVGALQVALEAVVAAGVGIYAFWASHRKHTQA
jgi:hypothetical protein